MNRPLIVVLAGIVVVGIAIVLNYLPLDDDGPDAPAAQTASAPQAVQSPAPAAPAAATPAAPAPEKPVAIAPVTAEPAPATATTTEAVPESAPPTSTSPTPAQAAETAVAKATEMMAQVTSPPEPAAPAVAPDAAAGTAGQPQVAAVAPAAPADSPAAPPPGQTAAPKAPQFDVVRINARGDTVMAGRAEPGAEVRILDGDTEIGRVKADGRGEWVFLPSSPLPPGSRTLSLLMSVAGAAPVPSGSAVVLVVPEQGRDIAGRAAEGDARAKPLAVVVPRDGGGATVLQKPVAGPAAEAATQTAQADQADQPGPAAEASRKVKVATPAQAPRAAATSQGMLAVDAVDYNDAGRLFISGHADDGTTVHLYLNNTFIGRAKTGSDGRWALQPDDPVAPGLYALRADQVDTGGAVVARVSFPFSRARIDTDMAPGSVVIVQPGNNLWRIAHHTYGEGTRYTVIFDANKDQIRDPDLIYPGQVFTLPAVN